MNAKQRKSISRALKRSWKSRHRKKKTTNRADLTAVPPTSELDDLQIKIERARELVEDGIAMCNEGWDLVNSIPKRVT